MDKLLGPAEIRELAERLGVAPTKRRGQNFLHDPNTIRRIVATARLRPEDVALEVGPGLGSLTLGLLPAVAHVHAVEIDPKLADALVETAGHPSNLTVHPIDALALTQEQFEPAPTAFVANLPYNVAVPVLLRVLAELPSIRSGLVMVQKEVADRLTAGPGSRVYGVPSAKLAWYASSRQAGKVSPAVFWPVPNVDSGLVGFKGASRRATTCRGRKSSRPSMPPSLSAARPCARRSRAGPGSAPEAERLLRAAGIDPGTRGEQLDVTAFANLAATRLAR